MNPSLAILMSMVSMVTAGTSVTVLLTIDASLNDMMTKNTDVITTLSTSLGSAVTCRQVCDKVSLECHNCGLTGTFSNEKRTHLATYYGEIDQTDLTAAAAALTTPLEAIFGTGNVQPTTINQLDDSSSSSTEAASTETVVSVTYETSIEFLTLRDRHQTLVTKTQQVLGGTGSATCEKICEMKALNQEHTLFELTPRCYQCDGRFMSRDAKVLDVRRWQITVVGSAYPVRDHYASELNKELSDYFTSNSGELHSVEVTVIVEATSDSDDSISGNTIAAVVVGCVGLVVLIIVVVFFCCFRRPEPEPEQELQQTKDAPDTPDSPETA
eukprot:TRINITY_DN1109_c1_g1_i1.p1 TRINITY_DN1109_c1_g1~~TRINITY_DN1109_c1_g1_i1.p1  ORF type:complete len:342 (+),score=77.12 TRINITY_DN1109_c1_g1_i1:47-1027(+)